MFLDLGYGGSVSWIAGKLPLALIRPCFSCESYLIPKVYIWFATEIC